MDEQEKAEFKSALIVAHGKVWNTTELQEEFIIESFAYGIAFGRRKSDGEKVSFDFSHSPRFYWL